MTRFSPFVLPSFFPTGATARRLLALFAFGLFIALFGGSDQVALAQAGGAMPTPAPPPPPPDLRTIMNAVDLKAPLGNPGFTTPIQLMFLMGGLTLLPFLFIATTPFIRIVVVLAFLKQATGLQNVPPGQVIIGMAIFLSMYIMAPTTEQINKEAILPYLNNRISQQTALERATKPLQAFMIKQTKQQELAFFLRLAKLRDPKTPADVPFYVVVPAYMISEVATGFKIGFIVYLPFIVVDLVITNVIMALGMQQLQTQMVAPPFKVMVFSLANGWHLLIEALVRSFK